MRSFQLRFLALGWLTLLGTVSPSIAQTPDHPNILFIAIDDLNDWVGPLGGFADAITDPQIQARVTPNLDRLAALGVTFTNAQAAAPACNPSRASLLTGIAPATSGQVTNAPTYFRDFAALRFATTLPQHLKKPDGVHTLYTIKTTGKVFARELDLPIEAPVPGGVTEWDEYPGNPNRHLPPGTPIDNVREDNNPWALGDLKWTKQTPTYRGRDVTDKAVLQVFTDAQSDHQKALWAAREVTLDEPGGQPKFIALGAFLPHLPWVAPAPFFDLFPLDKIGLPATYDRDLEDLAGSAFFIGKTLEHRRVLDHRTDRNYPGEDQIAWRLAIQGYLAATAYTDQLVGKALDAVVAKNSDGDPTNDWTVILWSDHGYHLGEKGRWTKFTLWEESARSPLMVWHPGLTRGGTRIDVPVDFLDIYPTISELAGIGTPPQLQGRSFVDLLRDPAARRDNYAFTTYDAGRHTARSRRWRYIRHPDGSQELYDHLQDPHEFTNLVHPINAGLLPELGLDAGLVEQVRRAHATALFDWSLRVHNRALETGALRLDDLDTLGARRIERFDGAGPLAGRGWTQRPGSGALAEQGFSVGAGVVRPGPGLRARATADGLALGAGEDFVTAVAVVPSGDTAGLGLLFGWSDPDNFYELQVVNQSSSQADGTMDLRLLRRRHGVEELLLRADDVVTSAERTLVARYRAANRELELVVQNDVGVNQFRTFVRLDEGVAAASQFGISSWAARGGGTFDDFVAVAWEEPVLFGAAIEVATGDIEVDEGAGIASVTVRRIGSAAGALSADYHAVEGSAWAGVDFALVPGTLTWGDGDTSERTIEVAILDDAASEIAESLTVTVTERLASGQVGGTVEARIAIRDNDPVPAVCTPGERNLCLNHRRFAVQAQWRTPAAGADTCHAVPLTDDSGTCWFFGPTNVELLVKVLDACAPPFERYWVFAAGLTNIETSITVADTVSGQIRRYDRPAGVPFAPLQDTQAFATCKPP